MDQGGQKGPRNGNCKHGRYTAEAMATRREAELNADISFRPSL